MLRRTVRSPSPDQLAAVSAHRDRWCKIGLSTEPARRAAAESAIADLYGAAGIPRAPRVVWCGSPMSVALARAAALDSGDASEPVLALPSGVIREARAALAVTGRGARALLGRPVSSNVWDGDRDARRVRHTSWWHLRNELPALGAEELRTQLVERVRAATWDAVWSQVLPCAWNDLREGAEGSLEDHPRQAEAWAREILRYLSVELISMHEQLGVLAALDFMREVCDAELVPAGHAALELARSAGWAVGYEGVCWVSERPSLIKLDGQGRLHCGDGPALVFRDGWSLFFWHGARVPSR